MQNSISFKYLQYGIPNHIAHDLESKGLNITKLRGTSKSDLVKIYGLKKLDIDFVKNCIHRKPIPQDTINRLLENSNYLCCLCKGDKSKSFIIHHINEYHKAQDNSYGNLAVLCLDDHDLAHREGMSLTHKITRNEILASKKKWEKLVKLNNTEKSIRRKSDFAKYRHSNVSFRSVTVTDNSKHTIAINFPLTEKSKLILNVIQSKAEQEFVVYLSILTDENDQKWIGFGTVLEINNIFFSERVYRIGRPGKVNYETTESIFERIRESGLTFQGRPTIIDKVRFWGWRNNKAPLKFNFLLVD